MIIVSDKMFLGVKVRCRSFIWGQDIDLNMEKEACTWCTANTKVNSYENAIKYLFCGKYLQLQNKYIITANKGGGMSRFFYILIISPFDIRISRFFFIYWILKKSKKIPLNSIKKKYILEKKLIKRVLEQPLISLAL